MSKCEICKKSTCFGKNISHSNKKTNRTWKINIKNKKIRLRNNIIKKMHICTSCLKNNNKIK